MLDDLFESDAIKALLGFDAIVGHFASPYSPGSAYVLLHHVVGEVNGTAGVWGHAVGGMGAITQAMAAEALAHGVTIKTEAEVSGIEIIKGRAQRVHLVDGSSLAADLVVANNVLAHVPDINDFVAGIARLLKPQGRASIECPPICCGCWPATSSTRSTTSTTAT